VVEQVKGKGAPVIYFGNGASGMLHHVATVPSDVIGVDWRIDIDRAWEQLGDVAVQGNLDPIALLGPPSAIEERVADIVDRVGGRPGHIFNLGHGLVPQTPPDNVEYVIDAVHRLSAVAN
jgi:uroporphyrinogen decarboxylase